MDITMKTFYINALLFSLFYLAQGEDLPVSCKGVTCVDDKPNIWCRMDTEQYSELETCRADGYTPPSEEGALAFINYENPSVL